MTDPMTDLSKAVERLVAWESRFDESVCAPVGVGPDPADLRTVLTALSAKDAELEKAREALKPLARLEIPERRNGNAGFYSIYHSDIGNARQALGETK